MNEELPFLHPNIAKKWKNRFRGENITQFCCNNGREILFLMQLGPDYGVGFDIAGNIIEQAIEIAEKVEYNYDFCACNILEVGEKYYNKFDFVFITTGAITWIKDINQLFSIAAKCLMLVEL